MTTEPRTTLFDDLTQEQQGTVERFQFVGVLVLVICVIGSGILDKVLHVNAWVNVGIVAAVLALDVALVTVLVARVLRVSPFTVAREGVRARGRLGK